MISKYHDAHGSLGIRCTVTSVVVEVCSDPIPGKQLFSSNLKLEIVEKQHVKL